MADSLQSLASLSLEERALLERRLLTSRAVGAERQGIPRRKERSPCPLSFAQQRLWFLEELTPGSAVYHIPSVLRVSGRLDLPVLRRVLDAIVQRHEALRTTFALVDGSPMQITQANASAPLKMIDLRQIPAAEREPEMQRVFTEESRRPFDLSRAPMLRAAVAQLGEQEYGLLFVMHHIAADGWSMGRFMRELVTLYDAFADGQPSPLPALPIQYADFALWQRQWLAGETLEKQLAFWKRQLEGIAPLELPLDHPRPSVQTYRAGSAALEIPPRLLEALKALSRDEAATLFMTLLAAFQVLLHRYTGQDDISVGSPIAGRTRIETEALIGFFVNSLVLRADLSGQPSFRQLLSRVREMALGAYAYQDLPFEKLVEELRPERDTSRTPLFQVLFVLQNTPKEVLQLPGLTITPLKIGFATAKWDLQLTLSETASGLKASMLYNADLFEAATIARMLGHYHNLLEAVVADPQRQINSLPLLPAAESQQLLHDWNATQTDYPQDQCIAQLVEAQVLRTHEAVAAIYDREELTYQELNRRANQLAHYLRAKGVGPEDRVGLCVERSLDMVVAMLAILKADGAYVPLDPSFPKERLAVMLGDAQPVMLLTQKGLVERLPANTPPILCLDAESNLWTTLPQENPVPRATPANLAYVLYTSGSTGTPKGVAMSHRSLVNLLTWQLQDWAVPGAARTLQFASMCFDVSFQEIFSTWCSGGTLVIVPEEIRRDPAGLAALMQQQAIRRAYLPPVVLQHLAEALENRPHLALMLREIITAGEQLQITPPVASFLGSLPGCYLQNHYGPTEAHVVTACTLEGAPQDWPVLPPIGRPIFNAQIYVLDSSGQPVPAGVPGELHIGGVCLARGYLNRPDLTAEKFVPDPFNKELGARLYRTGDLARWRADGQLEYLGRIDHQVKIRGFRIELGEVETVIGQHPAVREAVVLAREDRPGNKRLVAYIVANSPQPPLVSELRGSIRQKLPEYMVPLDYVFLKQLPLSPNGKVDRRALPAGQPSHTSVNGVLAPRNGFEQQLVTIWEKVLGLKSVGIRDNFFEVGGHSLLAVRLFAEIEKTFGQKLPLVALFQSPTIEQLAQLLRDHTRRNQWPTVIPVQPHGTKRPIFFIANPDVNALGYAFVSRRLGPDQPVYVLILQTENHKRYDMEYVGRWKGPNTPREHELLAATYLTEMRTIQPRGPYLLGGMCEGAHIGFAMARLLQDQGEKVALLAMIDAPARDNLNRLWHVHRFLSRLRHYRRRLGTLLRLKPSEQWRWLRAKFSLPRKAKPSSSEYVTKLPFYEGDITLFRVDKQSYWFTRDPELGWGRHTSGRVEIYRIRGEHRLILREPNVQTLAEHLKVCLDRIENHESGGESCQGTPSRPASILVGQST
jgi:amino acid adenylation domain-containing protein